MSISEQITQLEWLVHRTDEEQQALLILYAIQADRYARGLADSG